MSDRSSPTDAEILALETAYWEAMKAKDGKRSAELSGEISLVTGVHGVSSIPRVDMGAMTGDGDWELHSYSFDDVKVSAPAPNVAIIAYTVRQKMTMNGKTAERRAADSSTWIKGAGGWQCHAHSETFLDDGKAA